MKRNTPAARAALARRRQRAAEAVHGGSSTSAAAPTPGNREERNGSRTSTSQHIQQPRTASSNDNRTTAPGTGAGANDNTSGSNYQSLNRTKYPPSSSDPPVREVVGRTKTNERAGGYDAQRTTTNRTSSSSVSHRQEQQQQLVPHNSFESDRLHSVPTETMDDTGMTTAMDGLSLSHSSVKNQINDTNNVYMSGQQTVDGTLTTAGMTSSTTIHYNRSESGRDQDQHHRNNNNLSYHDVLERSRKTSERSNAMIQAAITAKPKATTRTPVRVVHNISSKEKLSPLPISMSSSTSRNADEYDVVRAPSTYDTEELEREAAAKEEEEEAAAAVKEDQDDYASVLATTVSPSSNRINLMSTESSSVATRSGVDTSETAPSLKPSRVERNSKDEMSFRREAKNDTDHLLLSRYNSSTKSASRVPTLRQIRRPPADETKLPSSDVRADIPSNIQTNIPRKTAKTVDGGNIDATPISVRTNSSVSSSRASKMPPPPSVNPDAVNLLPRRSSSPRRAVSSPERRLSPRRFGLPSSSSGVPVVGVHSPGQSFYDHSPSRTHQHQQTVGHSERQERIEQPETFSVVPNGSTRVTSGQSMGDKKPSSTPYSVNSSQPKDSMNSRRTGGPIRGRTEKLKIGLSTPLQSQNRPPNSSINGHHDGQNQHPASTLTPQQNLRQTEHSFGASGGKFKTPIKNGHRTSQSTSTLSLHTDRNGSTADPLSRGTSHHHPSDSVKTRLIDAASLNSGQSLSIKPCCSDSILKAESSGVLASIEGCGLGEERDTMKVYKILPESQMISDGPLNFGDTVIFQCPFVSNRALGVRRRTKDASAKNELGFFDVGNKIIDQWKITAFSPQQMILIGKAGLSSDADEITDSTSLVDPIQSGTPVLLRNCFNGGLLSARNGKLTLLTDSYDRTNAFTSDDPSLIGRLQAHDRFLPTPAELFQLVSSSAPPCPTWTISDSPYERVFWSGSYILHDFRNGMPPDLNAMMFPDQCGQYFFSGGKITDVPKFSTVPSDLREEILIDEVVGSFFGLEGLHIILNEEQKFGLSHIDGVSMGLRRTVEQILPLSDAYLSINDFIESHSPGYEYGRVMQALCGTLEVYMHKFVTFATKLEVKLRKGKEALTMHSLQVEATPFNHSMGILQSIAVSAREKKGGALINAIRDLEKRTYIGDSTAREIFATIMETSSGPYIQMLSSWLESGRLRDPYNEFMVYTVGTATACEGIDGDEWMSMFRLRKEDIISDMITNEASANKVLLAGKYWNAILACGVDVDSAQFIAEDSPEHLATVNFRSDFSSVAGHIDSMYQNASDKLVSLLIDKFRLKEALSIMKRYFLLDQGDFLVNFLENAEEELRKPKDNIQIGRVQYFLSLAVQQTEAQRDGDLEYSGLSCNSENNELLSPTNLRCKFSATSLLEVLDSLYGGIADNVVQATPSRRPYGTATGKGDTGFDLFCVDFTRIPFPLSLILSRHTMDDYKLLFRHLFFVKHVERRLTAVWTDHQRFLKKLGSLRAMLGNTFILRQRMLHFVQNLMNYMTFEVVESNWLKMISSLDCQTSESTAPNGYRQQTVDGILQMHDEFLKSTLNSCLLTSPVVIGSLSKVLHTCLLFTDQMKKFMTSTKIDNDSSVLASHKRGKVQRNLNEKGISKLAAEKQLHETIAALRDEREDVHQRQTRRVRREICSEAYKRMIQRFDEVFTADLAMFMVHLNSRTTSSTVANLGIRLDYNGFVGKSISRSKNVRRR